jgi:hypothetical protein
MLGQQPMHVLEVFGWEFAPLDNLTSAAETNSGSAYQLIYLVTGNILLTAMHLPSGVVIDHIEMDACNTSSTNSGFVNFNQLSDIGGPGGDTNVAQVMIGPGAGCTKVESAVLGLTVDNQMNEYEMETFWPTGDVNVGLRGVKVYYYPQVSPAPATATFNDVPTSDPAFQFIEAFSAAGITSGCSVSPPLYCPDGNVTRRQMAVFFAKALGLNWPN